MRIKISFFAKDHEKKKKRRAKINYKQVSEKKT
jgi:hypothetical protein